MTTLSTSDQQVWRKVGSSKNKTMTQPQIEASLPGMAKKEVAGSIQNLLKLHLFASEKTKEGVLCFRALSPDDARKRSTLTDDQQTILRVIGSAGNRGMNAKSIRTIIGIDNFPQAQLRKLLDTLEKDGHIKSFKTVQAPTMPNYCLAHLDPPEDITGGVWYDKTEFDEGFVDSVSDVLLNYVRKKTQPPEVKGIRPLYPASRTPRYPSPADLVRFLRDKKVTSVSLELRHVMQIMKKLELDGLVESLKPIGGVFPEALNGDASDSEGEPSTKRRKAESDDESADERRREKEKQRAKAKRKKEKEREKEKERAKRKEKKEKERQKAKRKKRKEKERERKKKKKRVVDSDEDELNSDDSDDRLVSINETNGDRGKKSKKKQKKRSRKASTDDSDEPDTDSSAPDSDSDSASDESESDSDDSDSASTSSVDSSDVDAHDVPIKSKSSAAAANAALQLPALDPLAGGTDVLDMSDTAVVFRATNRVSFQTGQTIVPCGRCPVWQLCEEGGAVNPAGCEYLGDWLADQRGGWDRAARERYGRMAGMDETGDVEVVGRPKAGAAGQQVNGSGADGDMEEGMAVDS